MLAATSTLVICCGIFCITDTDLAWRIYEWDCRMMSIAPPRVRNWRLRVKQIGSALIGLGLVGLIVSINT